MNTKVSVMLLLGLSVCLSAGAFAVSEDQNEDYLNWSYAMGTGLTDPMPAAGNSVGTVAADQITAENGVTCTEGCPGRPEVASAPMEFVFEDEVAGDNIETPAEPALIPVREKQARRGNEAADSKIHVEIDPAMVDAGIFGADDSYLTTETRVMNPQVQYPVSVQYPVTVQRHVRVEQPVVVQQPVVIRRPVVMQQDITVQRQPTVIQNQPMIMQQQPTLIQQQPMMIQTPAEPVPPTVIPGWGYPMPIPPTVPAVQPLPMMSMPQYQVQGQIQMQPIYQQPVYAPQPMWGQPTYVNPIY